MGGETEQATALAEEKAALRARMRAVRQGIPEDERSQAGLRAADRLASLDELAPARTVLVFSSFGSEIPTESLIDRLATGGWTVLLPFLVEGRMDAARIEAGQPLAATEYGPAEPPHRLPVDPGTVDLAVVPGLAFDGEGHRLGYGGGHYDRYLRRLRPGVSRIGICFHDQIVEAVPHGPGDERVDLIVTDVEVVDCRRPR
jgi:5-formyltetrahydrofolate cyclo-ligase